MYLKQLFVGGTLGESVRLAAFSRRLRDGRGEESILALLRLQIQRKASRASKSLLGLRFCSAGQCVVK